MAPDLNRKDTPRMEGKQILLMTKERRLFTFSNDIEKNSILILPFEIEFSEDFWISYNHSLNKQCCLNLPHKLKR